MNKDTLKRANEIQKELDKFEEQTIPIKMVEDIHILDQYRDSVSLEDIKNYSNVTQYRADIAVIKNSFIRDINKAINAQITRLDNEFNNL